MSTLTLEVKNQLLNEIKSSIDYDALTPQEKKMKKEYWLGVLDGATCYRLRICKLPLQDIFDLRDFVYKR